MNKAIIDGLKVMAILFAIPLLLAMLLSCRRGSRSAKRVMGMLDWLFW